MTDFSQTHEKLRERIRSFVETEMPFSQAFAIDRYEQYPQEIMNKMAQSGFMAVNIPKQYGGEGGGDLEVMIICEEICKRCPALAWTWGNVSLYGNNIISINGSESQQQQFLPRLAKGEMRFAFGLTEPDAGSDAVNIKTTAECKNGEWVINGSKMFITGGIKSDVIVTFARTASNRYGGITAFLVDTGLPGFSKHHMNKLGYRGSDTAELVYEDVHIKPDAILGGEEGLNKGWSQMVQLLNGERLALSACALGIGQAVMSEALNYFKSRGPARTATAAQSVEHRLAEMATELEAARSLAYHAAWLQTNGKECVKETSMSKIFCAETAKKVAVGAMDVMGPDGYVMASAVQRQLRDVLILSIGGGTTQVQKNIVAKAIGL